MKLKTLSPLIGIIFFVSNSPCLENYGDIDTTDSLKVITFNLYGAPNSDWPTRIRMILDELSVIQPDLIGLQEVVETPGYNGQDNRAKELADSLYYRSGFHYDYLFERTHFAWNQYDEGIAILSRHIILDSEVHVLPAGIFNRKLLWARILTPIGIVNFYDTHLCHGNQEDVRISQVTAIKAFIDATSKDSMAVADILCGDFNAIPDSPPIALLTTPDINETQYIDSWAASNPGQPGYTIPSNSPSSRIDYIFLRQNNSSYILSSKRVFTQPNATGIYPSDHIGVYSTFHTTFNTMSLNMLSPLEGQEVGGPTLICWKGIVPSLDQTVTIFISNDNGKTWWNEWYGQNIDNSYTWDTFSAPDGTRYLIRVVIIGDEIYAMGQNTGAFIVNNPGNAPPEIELISPRGGEKVSGIHSIRWYAGDAERDSVNTTLEVSVDDGVTWSNLTSYYAATYSPLHSYEWNTQTIANSPNYRVRLHCSDNAFERTETSGRFEIYNEHASLSDDIIKHVAGNSAATINVHVVNPSQLTGDRYRITFDDTLFGHTVYNVENISTGETPVRNAVELDGVTEGPLFDGLRLVINDFNPAEINHDSTGWIIGSSELEISIYVPTIFLGTETITGYAYPADYQIIIHDHVVDTSSSFLGAPEQPMMFIVWNITDNKKSEIIFNDLDNNYTVSRLDEIFILETDVQDNFYITWAVFFGGAASVAMPQPGDTFSFKTLKPLTNIDVYEFTTVTSIEKNEVVLPLSIQLNQNYPNPFNPVTTIQYTLQGSARVTLKIYNLLGQEIKTLVDDMHDAGFHRVIWNGTDEENSPVPSGLYLYQLIANEFIRTNKMVLIR